MQAPTFTEVKVVGMHFRGADVKALVANLEPPCTFTLEREPDNAYDEFAVKVFYGDIHIGYISRDQAMFLAPHMDEGQDFTCEMTEQVVSGRNMYPIVTLTPNSCD